MYEIQSIIGLILSRLVLSLLFQRTTGSTVFPNFNLNLRYSFCSVAYQIYLRKAVIEPLSTTLTIKSFRQTRLIDMARFIFGNNPNTS